MEFPRVKVTLAFSASRVLCKLSLTRYSWLALSYIKPKAFSKAWQASKGSHMCGTVESTYAKMPDGSNCVWVCLESVEVIEWMPTTTSRELSGANRKVRLFGVNLARS